METYAIVPSALKELGLACIGVYFALADRANDKNECWPSHRRIADDLQIGVTKVKEALLRLREAGWVTWETRNYDGGLKTSNIYTVRRVQAAIPDSRIPANDSHIAANGNSGWSNNGEPLGAMRRTDSRIPAIELIPKNYYPGTNSSSLADASDGETDPFDEFWTHYPRKVGKPAARKAFRQALKRATAADITAGAERLRNDPNLPDKSEEQYIPHASTWLNRDGWDDPPLPARQTNRPQGRVSAAALALSMIGEGA